MNILARIFESRVWIFAIAIIVHVIGIAVLEAHNEASRIAVVVISSIWLLIVHFYAAYLGYRLWYPLASHSQLSSPLPTYAAFPVHKSRRDTHSLWVWIDMFIALLVAWAFWSQSIHVMWENTFETAHKSSNEWVAMLQWWASLSRVAVGEDQPYEAIHPVTVALYAIPTLIFKIYELTLLVVGISRVWEHIHAQRLGGSETNDSAQTAEASKQASSKHVVSMVGATPATQSNGALASIPHERPVAQQTPFWNPYCEDELGLAKFLNVQYSQNQTHCARMDPASWTAVALYGSKKDY